MASAGNFAVFNPYARKGGASIDFEHGNCIAKHGNNKENTRHGTTFNIPNTGKWYFECSFVNTATDGSQSVMFSLFDVVTEAVDSAKNFLTQSGNFISFYSWQNRIYVSNSYTAYTGQIGTQTSGVVSVAIDRDNSHMWVAVNNTWINGTPDFTDGTNKVASPSASIEYGLAWSGDGGGTSHFWTANFGQDSTFAGTISAGSGSDANGVGNFKYAPPTDYLALTSANLTIATGIDPAGDNGDTLNPTEQVFFAGYTGNLSNRTITVENQPDIIMIRHTNFAQNWYWVDSSRGITANKYLKLDTNEAEATFPQSNFQSVTSSAVGISSGTWLNSTGANYQMWMWHINAGTTTTNNDGNTTSTIQVNAEAGMSIIQWTGTGSNSRTLGHGLGAIPKVWLIKRRENSQSWNMYHAHANNGSATGQYGFLSPESNGGYAVGSGALTYWYPTGMTTSTVGVGGADGNNNSGEAMIGYAFIEVDGYSKYGFYTGNGNADGTFIYTGFLPAMLWIKRTDTSGGWTIVDNRQYPNNTVDGPPRGELDVNNAYVTGGSASREMDLMGNGFKIKSSNSNFNASGGSYVYLAWASVPFRYNNGR